MSKVLTIFGVAAVMAAVSGVAVVKADRPERPLAVVMTNDPDGNQIEVYDAQSGALLQVLPTQGKGGVGGNARGVKQWGGDLVAVVNNGSNTVTVFKRVGDGLKLDDVVTTTSAPVSIDFSDDHMYVAGATSVDSFVLRRNSVGWLDGTTGLVLVNDTPPPPGSTAQVGVIDGRRLLVTLKADPEPGTVDVVTLRDGAVVPQAPSAVSAPTGTLTPFSFAVYPDGTALITLAHSNEDGLFRDGAFTAVVAAGQTAPCWITRTGKYAFTANTGSKTVSRLVSTGNNVFVDAPVAATIGGAPSDIDASLGVLGVIDHGNGRSHLSLFTYNQFGELTPSTAPIDLATPDANGVAIMAPRGDRP
jgi:hypothetical protein